MNEKLKEIITLLEEKGYDPVAQLTGYIETGSDDYITRHGNAREKIKEIERSVMLLMMVLPQDRLFFLFCVYPQRRDLLS